MICLVVTFMNNTVGHFPIPEDTGWRIDCGQRLIVVGHCIDRTTIPLDNVMYFELSRTEKREEDAEAYISRS